MAAATLPASWYVDAARHDRERRTVFGRSWLFLDLEDRLAAPGDYVATRIAGWPIVVIVGDDGTLSGHLNVCRHRAGPLVDDGHGHAPSLVCRYHGWAYARDGRLLAARDFGDDFACDGITLVPVQTASWRGLVFVNVAPEGTTPPLEDTLGGFASACDGFAIESFRRVAEQDFSLACNWKTYADNYLEGYHIPLVHPGLHKQIDTKRYEVMVHDDGRWVEQRAPARDGSVVTGRWLWRWPNLALNLYPDGMAVERYDPVNVRETMLRYTYAVANDRDVDEVIAMSSEVTAEDIHICEDVQRGLESGVYTEGWLSPRHEHALVAFQQWVREADASGQ